MSRSYKKADIYKQKNDKASKKEANRRLRRKLGKMEENDIPDGKEYRKHYPGWFICDWIVYCPEEEFVERNLYFYGSEEEAHKGWENDFKRK